MRPTDKTQNTGKEVKDGACGTYIVTRHDATIQWIQSIIDEDAKVVPHLKDEDIKKMKEGDKVYGILPLHLIIRLLQKGVEYYGIVLPNVPPEKRGQELSLSQIREYGGKILNIKSIGWEEWR